MKYRGNLSYEGASALGEMMDISTLYSGTGAIFGNPAGIANVNKIQLQADISLPGLGLNTSTKKSTVFRDLIQEGLDDFLKQEGVEGENRVDPEITTDMAQTPGLDGLGIGYRTTKFKWPIAITGAFERLVDFQMELNMNDVEAGVAMPFDESEPSSDSIKARFAVQNSMSVFLGLNRRGLGIASEFPRARIKFGLAVHQYLAYFDFSATGEVNGFISRNEQEAFFNLENSAYTDDLRADYYGYAKGGAAGVAAGMNWKPFRRFGIDAAISYNGTIRDGIVDGAHYILNAIDTEAMSGSSSSDEEAENGESEFFRISKLNLTKMTLTKRVVNTFDELALQLPSRMGISLYYAFPKLKINLDYAYYYRNMELRYRHTEKKTAFDTTYNDVIVKSDGKDSIETISFRGGMGSHLRHKAAMGLFLWGIFIQAGVYIAEPAIFFNNDYTADVQYMPILNIGYSFRSRRRLAWDFSLVQFPLTIFKTTVRYNL